MEGLLIIAIGFTFIGGVMFGTNTATSIIREETIIFCNQKPQECAKEFQYYQLKKEVQTMKENQK